MENQYFIARVGDLLTLPLFIVHGKTQEEIVPFAQGKVAVEYADPGYSTHDYTVDPGNLADIADDPEIAIRYVKQWDNHLSKFLYHSQFVDDPRRTKIRALHDHTQTISTLCDARLGVDTSELWAAFDGALHFEMVHSTYRQDANRQERYDDYAKQVHEAWTRTAPHMFGTHRLIERIVRQIELKRSQWPRLASIVLSSKDDYPVESGGADKLKVFYSYSHKDEHLRDQLESHLSLLKRQGFIEQWHDRKIGAGNDWKGVIDENLEKADIVLLLVSSDFLASDYCFDIELNRAMDRHEKGQARVVPIILRACDWTDSPFGGLQALPKDGKAISSWSNIDEAFTDVAKGLRQVVKQVMGKP